MPTAADPVVISGRAVVTPLGLDVDQTWDALLEGRSGIEPITAFDAEGFPCRLAAAVKGIDPEQLQLPRRESRIMDLHSMILMKCAQDAMQDSALESAAQGGEQIGFFAGIGMVDYRVEDLLGAISKSLDNGREIDYDHFYQQAYQEIFPLWPLSMLNNIALCQVAVKLGLKGENSVFSPHGEATLQAIWESVCALEEGRNRQILAGGVGEKLSETSLARALLHGLVSDRNLPCQPFSKDSPGAILGEGGGVVVLESRSSAEARGISPSVAISGYGCGFSQAPADDGVGPTAEAFADAMKGALELGGRKPGEVDLIISHGEGSRGVDSREVEAIRQLMGEAQSETRLYSSKGNFGHMLAGAPLVDLVLAERMMSSGLIPPTLTAGNAAESIAADILVTGAPLENAPKVVLINTCSYEGHTGSLLLESLGN